MNSTKSATQLRLALCLATSALTLPAISRAQAPAAAPATAPATKSQSELANPKVTFATIAGTDAKVKAALDSHNLAGAKALVGKPGALSGTIAGIYAPKGNKIVILNFDRDYKTAVSAVVGSEDFSKFPDLKSLSGKKVILTGKFKEYKETAELIVTSPGDVKLVK